MVTFFSAREQLFVMAEQFRFDQRRFRAVLAEYIESIDDCLHNGALDDLCRRMIETTAFIVKRKDQLLQANLSQESYDVLLEQLQTLNKVANYRIPAKIKPEIEKFRVMITDAMKEMSA